MGSVVYGSPFVINWRSRQAVEAYAEKLAAVGPAQAVIKYPGRSNYNITFVERLGELPEYVQVIAVFPGRRN